MLALEVIDVHVRYGSHDVLQGVSLSVPVGEWFCLLGPNGVGKSTLLHCLAGRVVPSKGSIRLRGASLLDDPETAKRPLGYACAPEQLPGLLTGRQCLEVYALAKNLSTIDAHVISLAEELRFTRYLDHYVDTYSLGTRQKLSVLLALLGEPRLIVLDEAFNGLDPRSALTLKNDLTRRLREGASVLLATHSLDIVEHHADRAALMIGGRIIHEWNEQELSELRGHGESLEMALAAASAAHEN